MVVIVELEQQVQLILEVVVELEEYHFFVLHLDVELLEDQELLLLDKFAHHQHIKTHQESGQLMTHIITRKLERGYRQVNLYQ